MIEPEHPELSVRRQCELLGLHRSTWHYRAAAAKMAIWMAQQGRPVNRKRVQQLKVLLALAGKTLKSLPPRCGDILGVSHSMKLLRIPSI